MPKQVQKSEVAVKVIMAIPGGEFVEKVWVGCDTLQHAKDTADRLQREFDDDCDPCRSYVYKDGDPIPVYAGMARFFYDKRKDYNRNGVPQRMN